MVVKEEAGVHGGGWPARQRWLAGGGETRLPSRASLLLDKSYRADFSDRALKRIENSVERVLSGQRADFSFFKVLKLVSSLSFLPK